MCGFIAAFTRVPAPETAVPRALERMTRRGPDAEGIWNEPGVAIGHRRLAIIDLDPRSAQPMKSDCGRYVIAFNGEIYNFRELRSELQAKGTVFRTTSDTEVLLALFASVGEAMLHRLQGMFAFVIWDRAARRAFVARDPYGIKPLYYAKTADGVVLGSQVKALLATGMVSSEPDVHGQAGFWLLGSVPEPNTWYRDISALPAGHCASIENGHVSTPRAWHDIGKVWREAGEAPSSDSQIAERVRAALHESVRRHLVADVPVGVFLSGGIDSGALAGMMVDAGARELQGVTVTYDEFVGKAEDETPGARQIAAYYGIRHHTRRVGREEFLADLPRIVDAMDQPSIDGINTWYASKAAAELGLKVVVSGVGGDELFMGYSSFRYLPRMVAVWRALARIPGATAAARAFGRLQAAHSGVGRWRYCGEWARTMAGAWWLSRSIFSPDELAGLMGSIFEGSVIEDFDAEACVKKLSGILAEDPRMALSQMESTLYLRNQLLRDSDWASMDHSVELRTPLVDAHLLQQLQPLLPAFERFPNKRLLSGAPSNPLLRETTERPKSGFGIPVERWLEHGRSETFDAGSRSWAREIVNLYTQHAK